MKRKPKKARTVTHKRWGWYTPATDEVWAGNRVMTRVEAEKLCEVGETVVRVTITAEVLDVR